MLDLWNGAAIDPSTIYAATCSENGVSSITPVDVGADVARLRAALHDLRFDVEGWTRAGNTWYLLRLLAAGTHIGSLETPVGTAAPSGARLELRGLEAFEVRNARISAVWLAWDWSDVFRALSPE